MDKLVTFYFPNSVKTFPIMQNLKGLMDEDFNRPISFGYNFDPNTFDELERLKFDWWENEIAKGVLTNV